MENFTEWSDLKLLQRVVGLHEAEQIFQGRLRPLFLPQSGRRVAFEKLGAAQELVKRMLLEGLEKANVLNSPRAVRDYLHLHFLGKGHECFITIFLNAQHGLIAAEEIFRGTLTQTSVYPREIVKRALHHNAAAVIFAHNHPSGVAEPSRADELLTQALKAALDLVDIKVLDHVVIGEGTGAVSFAERGIL